MTAVAIDGPVGAGKSSVARACAKKLGFIYVDTGALYRACGLKCKRCGVEIIPENADAIGDLLNRTELKIKLMDGVQHVFLDGEDVSEEIRLPEISMAASAVSALPVVRQYLLGLQRQLAAENNVIMDGRDIGTVVLPNAQVKIFITAKPEVRAKRRYDELAAKGLDVDFQMVLDELNQRDYQDSHRETAPLKQAEDAVLLDTTDLDFEQTVARVTALVTEKTDKKD